AAEALPQHAAVMRPKVAQIGLVAVAQDVLGDVADAAAELQDRADAVRANGFVHPAVEVRGAGHRLERGLPLLIDFLVLEALRGTGLAFQGEHGGGALLARGRPGPRRSNAAPRRPPDSSSAPGAKVLWPIPVGPEIPRGREA